MPIRMPLQKEIKQKKSLDSFGYFQTVLESKSSLLYIPAIGNNLMSFRPPNSTFTDTSATRQLSPCEHVTRTLG